MLSPRPIAAFLFAASAVLAQHVGVPTDDLDKVSVDELFNVQVTSVGRKAQELSKAPAAIFVISADDIRRTGATSIPEALQWVPGLTVLRVDGRNWVVSARGGAREYANKMLVMVDGRSLYTPMFSGVIWDAIDLSMSDIERIEVVRGPGAVMWGLNAVNGVINIITKSAQATKGGQARVATGNELRNDTEVRWGAQAGDRLAYRVWGEYENRMPAFGSPGGYFVNGVAPGRISSIDNLNWATGALGVRLDATPGNRDQVMVQADAFQTGRQELALRPVLLPNQLDPTQTHTGYIGGSIQTRWTHNPTAGSESELQFSYAVQEVNYTDFGGTLNNLTLDYQRRRQTGEHNEIYWGGGYQQYWDQAYSGPYAGLTPASATYRAGDVVLRDEWQFIPGRWTVSAGVRLDYTSYSRLDYQPSVRLLYTPNHRQSVWFAVSRALRVPDRIDRNFHFIENLEVFGIPVKETGHGSLAMRPETERSAEAGYRVQSGQRWSVDTSVYFSYHQRLRVLEGPLVPQFSVENSQLVASLPLTYDNSGAGRSYGGEVWATIQVMPNWRLMPSYSYLNESRWLPASMNVARYWDASVATVPHQGLLRSQHTLSRNWELDLMARVRSHDTGWNLPGVLLLDAHLNWHPSHSGELSFGVKDLANRKVFETYAELLGISIPTRRTLVLQWTQRF